MELYGTVKHVDPRSVFCLRATEILQQSPVHHEGRYVGMLWSSDEVKLPNNLFQQWCSSIHRKND